MQPVRKIIPLEKRKKIHRIFRRHRGASNQLANRLGVHRINIVHWFNGRTSKEFLETAILHRAKELVATEQAKRQKQASASADTANLERPRAA